AAVAAPGTDGRLCTTCSIAAQASAAAAVATKVLMNATAVTPLASRLDPALKPNQPTHGKAAPINVIGSECGGIASVLKPRRGPMTRQPTRPAMPALIWTTVPPGKSGAPRPHSRPC